MTAMPNSYQLIALQTLSTDGQLMFLLQEISTRTSLRLLYYRSYLAKSFMEKNTSIDTMDYCYILHIKSW